MVGSQLFLNARVQMTALGTQGSGLRGAWEDSLCPHTVPWAGGQAQPCPRQVVGLCREGPEDPECSMGPLLGPFSSGLSEDNPPVQVVPAPTPLVPHFQVLLLDLLKVLQQLCIVDAGGVCFLQLGGCLQTVSREREQRAQRQCLSIHGSSTWHRRWGPCRATGW